MNTTPTTPARAAAEWWARQLAAPTFRSVTPDEIRADPDAGFGDYLAHILAAKHPVTPDQLRAFADNLECTILDGCAEFGLHVDYHPDQELADAARTAGIDTCRFPIKTHMWLHAAGHVTARLGYAAPERLIWAPDGWQHPACDNIRRNLNHTTGGWTETYYPEVCGLPKYHDGDCGSWAPDTLLCARCGATRAEHWNDPDWGRPSWHSFAYPVEAADRV